MEAVVGEHAVAVGINLLLLVTRSSKESVHAWRVTDRICTLNNRCYKTVFAVANNGIN